MSTTSLRLEPDATAARVARGAVRDAIPEPAREHERDLAMLLVSELVTNAVVHAASGVDVEVDVQAESVTVRVRDADTGPLVMRAGGGSELDEGGRGFLLVDRLSDAWGTEHHGGRKTVWFRVVPERESPRSASAGPPVATTKAPPSAPAPTAQMLHRLLIPPSVAVALTFDEHVGELLLRVVDAVGAAGAVARVNVGDTATVSRGDVNRPSVASCDLVIGDRVVGSLQVHARRELDPEESAFVSLAADRLALLVAEERFLQDERGRAVEPEFLAEATELLTRSSTVAMTLALVTQIVVPRLGEWCAAYAVDDRGRARRLTVNHRREERVDAVAEVLDADAEVSAAVAAVAQGGPLRRLPGTLPVGGQRTHVTVLPLQSRGRTLGLLVVGRRDPFDPVQLMASLELARRVALAVDNARLHEERADTVSALQASLLPPALPEIDGVRLGARYHSASTGVAVGGDFYDAFRLAPDRFVVAIGDVCGKGAEAAAVTGMTRDLLRLLMQDGASPAGALRRLNRALIDHPTASRFCTVALAEVVHADDTMTARLCLAGHPEPMLVDRQGVTTPVGTPGELLGVLDTEDLRLLEAEVDLEPGSSLVLYTDGVTERREGTRMFGQYGVRKTLQQLAGADAQAIADGLEAAARSFVEAELRDDLAIVVVQRTG